MPIYNLIEYSSNYSEAIRSLWFYSKDEATNFNTDTANTDDFKSLKYKAKLLGNTEGRLAPNNTSGILKNAAIAVPLKHLSNFWRSLEIPLINCKVYLKHKRKKYCVLTAAGADNTDGNLKNITFTFRDAKLYIPVVTLSTQDNQKWSELLSKGFERLDNWDQHKTKSQNKDSANE